MQCSTYPHTHTHVYTHTHTHTHELFEIVNLSSLFLVSEVLFARSQHDMHKLIW
jgi:hypothetical protein